MSELDRRAAVIRASGLFKDAEYDLIAEARTRRQDPARHYLTTGEASGARPSRLFDPLYYSRKYGIEGDSPLLHYILAGRDLGLRPLPVARDLRYTTHGLREGYRRVVFMTPDEPRFYGGVLNLLTNLRSHIDAIVVFPDEAPADARFESIAAGLVFPSAPIPRGWDAELEESAYLGAEIAERYQPASAICCGLGGLPLLERLSARFIPTVTLAFAEMAPAHGGMFRNLHRGSAAVLFASQPIQQRHMTCSPWLASRRTALAPLCSDDPADGASAAQTVLFELEEAECRFARLKKKHEMIGNGEALRSALPERIRRPREFIRRLRENFTVGGLSTGGAPEFHVPRLIRGFNARQYALDRQIREGNPLIDYLIEGHFDRYLRQLISPNKPGTEPSGNCRAALHGHYYYADLAEELFPALSKNRHPVDLYLSTDTEAKASQLADCAARHGAKATVRVLPNKGRDLGPFLTGFRDLFSAGYDVIGHVHGKKSVHVKSDFGESWRRFLLETTIGGTHAMMDAVIAAFASNERLGMAFAEPGNTLGWDRNLESAAALARRMNMEHVLAAPSFEYPAGSFFWCRPAALGPILSLALDWADYPAEPLPHDGSLLHAIERLLGLVCEEAGFDLGTITQAGSTP